MRCPKCKSTHVTGINSLPMTWRCSGCDHHGTKEEFGYYQGSPFQRVRKEIPVDREAEYKDWGWLDCDVYEVKYNTAGCTSREDVGTVFVLASSAAEACQVTLDYCLNMERPDVEPYRIVALRLVLLPSLATRCPTDEPQEAP